MTRFMTAAFALSIALAPALSSAGEEPAAKDCTAALAAADDDVMAFYPPKARAAGIEGTATIECGTTGSADQDCKVISEAPPEQGFGKAAVDIVAAGRRRQQAVPDQGPRRALPITFRFRLSPPSIRPNPFKNLIAGKMDLAGFPSASDAFTAYLSTSLPSSGGSGEALLSCVGAKDGHVTSCTIASETPPHARVGAAALSLTRYFRLKPTTEFGCSVEGLDVNLPMRFNKLNKR